MTPSLGHARHHTPLQRRQAARRRAAETTPPRVPLTSVVTTFILIHARVSRRPAMPRATPTTSCPSSRRGSTEHVIPPSPPSRRGHCPPEPYKGARALSARTLLSLPPLDLPAQLGAEWSSTLIVLAGIVAADPRITASNYELHSLIKGVGRLLLFP